MIFNLLGSVVVGIIAGSIAKALMSKQDGGLLNSLILGIGGALVGGFLGNFFLNSSFYKVFSLRGLIFSTIGAVVILAIQGFLSRRK